jgi:hypothetical protein
VPWNLHIIPALQFTCLGFLAWKNEPFVARPQPIKWMAREIICHNENLTMTHLGNTFHRYASNTASSCFWQHDATSKFCKPLQIKT